VTNQEAREALVRNYGLSSVEAVVSAGLPQRKPISTKSWVIWGTLAVVPSIVLGNMVGRSNGHDTFVVTHDVEGDVSFRDANPFGAAPKTWAHTTFSAGDKVTRWANQSYSGKIDCYVQTADLGYNYAGTGVHAVMVGVLPCEALRVE
jgi:hypothetical protein